MAQLAPAPHLTPGNQIAWPDAPVWSQRANGVSLTVELGLGWADDPTFALDDPETGQLDLAILGSDDAPWFDVSCDVRACEWGMGAQSMDGVLTRWEAGAAQIVLGNDDAKYNVENMGKRLLPMVKVRITARSNGAVGGSTVYPMWYGYVDSFVMAWQDMDSTVTVTATDGTKLLGAYDAPALPDPGVGAGDTATQRAKRILAAASWPDGTNWPPDATGTLRMATTMAEDSWTQLLLNQDAELGATYIDRDGSFVFRTRDVWVAESISDGTYDAQWGPDDLRYENVTLKSSDTELRNIVYAARPGGIQQNVQDTNSVAQFLPHTYGRDDLPFTTDGDSLTWANLVLQTSAWPEARFETLEVLPQIDPLNLWPVVLSTTQSRFGARWLLTVQTPGMDAPAQAPCRVRGWKHTVDLERWHIVYTLEQAPVIIPFVLDGTQDGQTLDSMRLTDAQITSVSPPSAPAAGGTGIQINGKGFTGATAVTIGGVAMDVRLVLDTNINGYIRAGAPAGLASIVVTTPSGIIQLFKGYTLT